MFCQFSWILGKRPLLDLRMVSNTPHLAPLLKFHCKINSVHLKDYHNGNKIFEYKKILRYQTFLNGIQSWYSWCLKFPTIPFWKENWLAAEDVIIRRRPPAGVCIWFFIIFIGHFYPQWHPLVITYYILNIILIKYAVYAP